MGIAPARRCPAGNVHGIDPWFGRPDVQILPLQRQYQRRTGDIGGLTRDHIQQLPLGGRFAEGPAFAHAVTKQMLESEAQMSLAAAIEAEAQAQAICMMHPDFKAAYEANIAKKAPRFEGGPDPEVPT